MAKQRTEPEAIAIVGLSALFPGAQNGQQFWHNILTGSDQISDVPPSHWLVEDYYDPKPGTPGKIYAQRGGFLPDVAFDPLKYGLPPNQLSSTDTAQLLSLIVAEKVLEDALSFQFDKVDRQDVSVILGVASATELVAQMAARIQRPHWIQGLREAGIPESQVETICERIEATYPEWNESTFPGLLGNVVAGRIANRLNLGGTNCVIDAACASSLGAVAMGMQELQLGHSDLVITGGADTLNDSFMYMCFSQTPALSPTGDCRPFSEDADGTLLGEGIGMLALRRLGDAERDGDHVYGVIRGLGSSSDGRAKSIYAPRAEGQATALRRAYEQAGYGPAEVELVEAHGTATKAGDAAEFEGLRQVFSANGRQASQWCALGSIKAQIGHTKAAAGAASLIKVVMALHHQVLPPTLKVNQPNGRLDIMTSPFYLNTQARPWICETGKTRKGSVSSFGFGGSNFHLTVEEYAGPAARAPRLASFPEHLFVLSADSPETLQQAVARLDDTAQQTDSLSEMARESQQDFDPQQPCRLALIAADASGLADTASAIHAHLKTTPERSLSLPGRLHYLPEQAGLADHGIALLFPGQGSQYINMGADIALAWPAAQAVWNDSATLWHDTDTPLHQIVFPHPAFDDAERQTQSDTLTGTEWAQPAIGTVSLSIYALLTQAGIQPRAVAGHSYGEITALHAAGAFPDTNDMLRISRRRGELMRDAAATQAGAMLAIQADADSVANWLTESGQTSLTLANINSPCQTVVAGEQQAIQRLENTLQEKAIPCRRLPVATAFHTALVADCSAPLATFLEDCHCARPTLPVYSNTLGTPYPTSPERIRQQLAEQLAHPVKFTDMVDQLYTDGCRIFIETGPGTALTGMVNDCLGYDRPHWALATDNRQRDGRTALFDALGQLSALGVKVDYAALWADFATGHALPASPSAAAVTLNGANTGKPYPPTDGARGRHAPNPEPTPAPESTPHPEPIQDTTAMTESRRTPEPAPPASHAADSPASATPRVAAHTPAAPSPAPQPSAEWLAGFAELQRQTLEAQQSYNRALTESHQAFLRASETAFTQLGQLGMSSTGHQAPASPASLAPTAATPPPAAEPPRTPQAVPAPPPAPRQPQPAPADTAPTAPETLQPQTAALEPARAPDAPRPDALLFEVVADKTGYPTDMLSMDMELEAGLGIDSIKRVEILSVLQEKLPALAAVDPAELARLETLGDIVEFANQQLPATPLSPGTPDTTHIPASEPQVAASDAPPDNTPPDIESLLFEVVADKTGYPTDMLSMDMELEAGLGIDSIKRVEILSVLQEKLPALAAVDPAELARLETLGDIIQFAHNLSGDQGDSAKKPEPDAGTPSSDLTRQVVTLTERPPSGIVTPGLFDAAPLFVVADPEQQTLAEDLVTRLDALNIRAQAISSVPPEAHALILLTGLGQIDPPNGASRLDAHTAMARNEALFRQVRQCAKPMRQSGRLLITLQDTGGDFGIGGQGSHEVWASGISALARTAAREWPQVCVRALDLATQGLTSEQLAERLVTELLVGGADGEIGLPRESHSRLAPVTTPQDTASGSPLTWQSDDVIVVSGGARGVTTACLHAMMEQAPTQLALLGRTRLTDEAPAYRSLTTDAELKQYLLQASRSQGEDLTPAALGAKVQNILAPRELRANLARLEAVSSRVVYYALDINSPHAVKETLTRIRREQGPIRGLIHAAGVLADKPIADKSDTQFQRVFRTKVHGLSHLLAATQEDPLQLLAVFSSVAARTGNPGQADYAMANEVLNRVCRQEAIRRGDACRVKAIGWGPWAGGMVTEALQTHFRRQGVGLIDLDEGAQHFAAEVSGALGGAVETLYCSGLDNFATAHSSRATQAHASYSVCFREDLWPWLHDHRINGQVVVPLVLVIHLACSAARESLLGHQVSGCTNLEVVDGLQLEHFTQGGDWYRLDCTPAPDDHKVAVSLVSTDGTQVFYRLDVVFDQPLPDTRPANTHPAWHGRQPTSGHIYDGRLFHGSAMQSLTALTGQGAEGASAVLQHHTPQTRSSIGPLDVLDGGLQLALLWVHDHAGCESLPMALGKFHFHAHWPQSTDIRCHAICHDYRPLTSLWQLDYIGPDDRLLATLDNLKLYHLTNRPSRHQPTSTDNGD